MATLNVIHEGHILDVLPTLPERSVQCVITSPPYWGLRVYGTPSSIWGGERECQHEWEPAGRSDLLHENRNFKRGTQEEVEGSGPLVHLFKHGSNRNFLDEGGRGSNNPALVSQSQTCVKCSAWLGHYGLEESLDRYVSHTVMWMREVRRVLRDDGTMWLDLGDSFASGKGSCFNPGGGDHSLGQDKKEAGAHPLARGNKSELVSQGLKPKDLCMMPFRVALALQADGWWLRSVIPWLKRNPMPESCQDRPPTAVEYIFLLTKKARYFYDIEAGRRKQATADKSRFYDPAEHPGPGNLQSEARAKISAYAQNRPRDARGIFRDQGKRFARIGGGRIEGSRKNRQERLLNPAGRARRNSDWFFESLQGWQGMLLDDSGAPLALLVNPQPYPGTHYATFPERMVEPCVLLGTSPHACAKCGAPWERVIDQGETSTGTDTEAKRTQPDPGRGRRRPPEPGQPGAFRQSTTLGFRPTCSCSPPDDSGKSIVLDPFAGSGTTGVVALRLGRDFIGCDLMGGDKDFGKGPGGVKHHTGNQRLAAAQAGLTLGDYVSGQKGLEEKG